MIQLKNVSKFYYSKGMIASGFTKVNLELNIGEFVVITGESGSGKTTLLNVISGLDTYEEGEMYVDGGETSHYSPAEFEEYRKKYIGDIFQNFNLVGSYTVYQNVELILLINGYSHEDIAEKVPAIIERVGLTEYSKTKVSKLSGGQKQRVCIARALAKETSVIVADEPTGNLDSKAADDIVELLSEIAKDKLVVVVTHNYEQFDRYATRVVRMNDGRIVEDKIIREVAKSEELKESFSDNITVKSKIRLGVRNAFNILPKFILLLIVFLFVVFSVSAIYTNFKQNKEETSMLGYNEYFANYTDDRIVVKKSDGTAFTDADYDRIQKMDGVASIEKDDIMLDTSVYIEQGDFSFYGYPYSMESFKGTPDVGEMPQADDEVIVCGTKDDYSLTDNADAILNQTYSLYLDDGTSTKVTVTGIKYIKSDDYDGNGKIYLPSGKMDELRNAAYLSTSDVETLVNGKALKYEGDGGMYKVSANDKVKAGQALVSDELDSYYDSGKITGKNITVSVSNLYYKDSVKLKVADTYSEKTFKAKTGLRSYEDHSGEIYVNRADYSSIFNNGTYQSSVFADSSRDVDGVVKDLRSAGFKPMALKDSLQTYEEGQTILDIIQIPFAIILVLAIFFIAYFVIRLILKSRDVYFSILRILGLQKKAARRILDIELFLVITIAYGVFIAVVGLAAGGIINVEYIQNLVSFLTVRDYVILYAAMAVIAFLISGKFARKLFKNSAMDAYRGEA